MLVVNADALPKVPDHFRVLGGMLTYRFAVFFVPFSLKSHNCSRAIGSGELLVKGTTPIQLAVLEALLEHYPDKENARWLLSGFRLQYTGPRLPKFSKNLKSAELYKDVLLKKLHSEIELGKITL